MKGPLARTAAAVLAVILGLQLGHWLVNRSDGFHSVCPECGIISCVPFPFWTENKWWYCDGCDQVLGGARRTNESYPYYAHAEMFCPNGDLWVFNITDQQYTDTKDISLAMSKWCRANCLE